MSLINYFILTNDTIVFRGEVQFDYKGIVACVRAEFKTETSSGMKNNSHSLDNKL